MNHRTLLKACLILLAVQLTAPPAMAKILSVESIKPSFPEDPPYGEIVRELRVQGNRYTRESIIKQAFKSRVGHPYSEENAKLDLLWIGRLGAFTAVSFSTEPLNDGIALIVTVREASPYIPSLSFKLTQENGVEIGPAFSSSNLFGTAARVSAYARFGGATNIGIRYADPQMPGKSWIWGYKVQYFHRERTNELLHFQEKTDEVFFEFRRNTSDEMRTGLRFRYLGLGADRPGITLDTDNHDDMPSLGLFVQHESRNGIYPTDGWYMDLELGKYGLFGGNGDFWRLDMDVRRYGQLPLLGDRHSMAVSSYASLVNGDLGTTVPIHQEFFIGGTNSVRGWALGSRQGQNQWLNTAEYWFRLMDQKIWQFWFIKWRMGFQLGLYGDFGTSWTEYQDLDKNMIGGFGVGFRLTMPVVTMIRFDLGYGEDGLGVRMFVGGAEKAEAQKQRVR